jgi:replicative DNA helicase
MSKFSDLDSEKAVIGCVLLNNEVIENAIEILTPKDFFDPKYQRIFSTMQTMYENNEPMEPLSVSKRTVDCYPDTDVSEAELEEIANNSPAPSNIEFYAQRVIREYSRREAQRLLDLAKKEIEDAEDPMSKIAEVVTRMENIRSDAMDQTVFDAQSLFIERMNYLEKKSEGLIENDIISTGLRDLDDLLRGGIRFQHFDVLAARPGMGKTSLAVQWAVNSVLRQNISSLIFSIEMSKEEVMDKMISNESKIPYGKISSGQMEAEDWETMIDLSHKLISNPNNPKTAGIFVDDVTKDLHRMVAIIRRCVRKYNVKFVVIDYLQLISISGKFGTRDEQLGYAVNLLAYTAKTLNINILALSQLNRGVENREARRPSLSDLRESGNIEQAAWRVFAIYRDEYYNQDSSDKGVAEISVLKGKISNTGKVQVYFDKDCTRFSNLAYGERE